MNSTLVVERNDFSNAKFTEQNLGDLAPDCIRVDIGPFALTANNITYMAVGDLIGYWQYFDPKAYGMNLPDMGRMPVWGYAVVSASNCAGIEVGTRIYGFFPIAGHMDIKPVKRSEFGFQDGIEHRAGLHSIYNSYVFTKADPSFAAQFDDLQPVLRPLFTTSFLIGDFFKEEKYFGAEQIIVLSASSKTALGTAFCLKRAGGARVVGLTSDKNIEFVKSTGYYDQVIGYDNISSLTSTPKTALIDMAGNGKINGDLYSHFGANIVYNCMVGKSHWQGDRPPKIEVGAPPAMFFAPDRAKKRISDWGGAGFAKNLGASWMPFCADAIKWMAIKTYSGEQDLLENYHALLAGKVDPALGQLFTL